MDVVTYALAQKYVKNAIGSLDTVTDVTVDGNSVVNADGVAEIVTPQILGEVADVKVDGQSVVDSEGVAQITLPDSANAISYDNSESGLDSTNVQDAVDEVLDKANKVDDVQTYGGNTLVTNKIADLSALTMKKSVPSTPTAIATFADGAEMVMPSLTVGVEAVQDLHGYDSPWVGGAGKNKLPLDIDYIKQRNTGGTWVNNVFTSNTGVTFTVLTNSVGEVVGVKVNGTATERTQFIVSNGTMTAGNYIFNGCPFGGSGSTYEMFFQAGRYFVDVGSGVSVTLSADTSYGAIIDILNGTTIDKTFYPMLRLSTETDATFAPYSNICPIIGWNEAVVTRCGKNLFPHNSIAVYDYYFSTQKAFSQMRNPFFMKGGETYVLKIDDGNKLFRMRAFDKNHNIITATSKIGAINHGSNMGLVYYSIGEFYGYNGSGDDNITVFRPTEDMWFDSTVQTTSPTEIMLEVGDTPTTYSPYNGATYTIDLNGTRYGGTLDATNGTMTVDRVSVDLSTLSWDSGSFGTSISWKTPVLANMKSYADGEMPNILCEKYKPNTINNIYQDNVGIGIRQNGSTLYVNNQDSVNSPTGQLVYELATPLTIQLTPTAVKSLVGDNNVFADSGEILEGEYIADASAVIAGLDARITALENA